MFLTYLKKRTPGYYVYVGAAILSLAAAITYIIGFTGESMSKYMSFAVFFYRLRLFYALRRYP